MNLLSINDFVIVIVHEREQKTRGKLPSAIAHLTEICQKLKLHENVGETKIITF